MSAIEIGSDIGPRSEILRNYCGVYGHKPTWGVVPYRGHYCPAWCNPTDISVAPGARTPWRAPPRDLSAMMILLPAATAWRPGR